MEKKYYKFNDLEIEYFYKEQKYDCSKLLIVFSGFGSGINSKEELRYGYDCKNTLSNFRGGVLYIRDKFGPEGSYYIFENGEEIIAEAVSALIAKIIKENFFEKKDTILIGFSKGGSAALYFSIKDGFSNVIACVPQLDIFSYVKENHPETACYMFGEKQENLNIYSDFLIKKIINDPEKNKNIYLLTSVLDEQYNTQISPYVDVFNDYTNFNIVLSSSDFIEGHGRVTWYNVQTILGILYCLGEGIFPRFNVLNNGGGSASYRKNRDSWVRKKIAEKELKISIEKIKIDKNKFYPEGIFLWVGNACANYDDVSYSLIIKSDEYNYSFRLGAKNKKELSKKYLSKYFVNYDKAWFSSISNNGLDFSCIKNGDYSLYIVININGARLEERIPWNSSLNIDVNGENIRLYDDFGWMKIRICKND